MLISEPSGACNRIVTLSLYVPLLLISELLDSLICNSQALKMMEYPESQKDDHAYFNS